MKTPIKGSNPGNRTAAGYAVRLFLFLFLAVFLLADIYPVRAASREGRLTGMPLQLIQTAGSLNRSARFSPANPSPTPPPSPTATPSPTPASKVETRVWILGNTPENQETEPPEPIAQPASGATGETGKPAIDVRSLTVNPAEINPGEWFTVEVMLANSGGPDVYELMITLDGVALSAKTVELEGESVTLASLPLNLRTAGKHTISAGIHTRELFVRSPDEPVASASPVPVAIHAAPELTPFAGIYENSLMAGGAGVALGAAVILFFRLFVLRKKKY